MRITILITLCIFLIFEKQKNFPQGFYFRGDSNFFVLKDDSTFEYMSYQAKGMTSSGSRGDFEYIEAANFLVLNTPKPYDYGVRPMINETIYIDKKDLFYKGRKFKKTKIKKLNPRQKFYLKLGDFIE